MDDPNPTRPAHPNAIHDRGTQELSGLQREAEAAPVDDVDDAERDLDAHQSDIENLGVKPDISKVEENMTPAIDHSVPVDHEVLSAKIEKTDVPNKMASEEIYEEEVKVVGDQPK